VGVLGRWEGIKRSHFLILLFLVLLALNPRLSHQHGISKGCYSDAINLQGGLEGWRLEYRLVANTRS
jgi:predicted transcriptional regulator with HTH domain